MRKPKLDELLMAVAKYRGTTPAEMTAKGRSPHVVEAREHFTAIAQHYGYRKYEISWALHQSRSAITRQSRRWTDLRRVDKNHKQKYEQLLKQVTTCYC